jgi:hypothetical protein
MFKAREPFLAHMVDSWARLRRIAYNGAELAEDFCQWSTQRVVFVGELGVPWKHHRRADES